MAYLHTILAYPSKPRLKGALNGTYAEFGCRVWSIEFGSLVGRRSWHFVPAAFATKFQSRLTTKLPVPSDNQTPSTIDLYSVRSTCSFHGGWMVAQPRGLPVISGGSIVL
jgi:hypothetical protein